MEVSSLRKCDHFAWEEPSGPQHRLCAGRDCSRLGRAHRHCACSALGAAGAGLVLWRLLALGPVCTVFCADVAEGRADVAEGSLSPDVTRLDGQGREWPSPL